MLQETRLNNSNLVSKTILRVVAVTGTFLAIRRQPITYNLMGYATINDELNSNGFMLQHRLMTTLDNPSNKFLGAAVCDLVFGFVADSSGLLNGFQNLCPIGRRKDMKSRFDNLHTRSSLILFVALIY